jgi:hypothetical protein
MILSTYLLFPCGRRESGESRSIWFLVDAWSILSLSLNSGSTVNDLSVNCKKSMYSVCSGWRIQVLLINVKLWLDDRTANVLQRTFSNGLSRIFRELKLELCNSLMISG